MGDWSQLGDVELDGSGGGAMDVEQCQPLESRMDGCSADGVDGFSFGARGTLPRLLDVSAELGTRSKFFSMGLVGFDFFFLDVVHTFFKRIFSRVVGLCSMGVFHCVEHCNLGQYGSEFTSDPSKCGKHFLGHLWNHMRADEGLGE